MKGSDRLRELFNSGDIWTENALVDRSGVSRGSVRRCLAYFVDEGWVEKITGRPHTYQVFDSIPELEGYSSDCIWYLLKTQKVFRTRELAAISGLGYVTVSTYLSYLHRAGYVRRYKCQYQLIRDTGLSAPLYDRTERVIRDPNTGEVHPIEKGR